MAELIVGSFAFDMTTWNLADIAGGTVTSDTSGEVDVTGAGGHLVYTITGSGFTTFDTNGFPTDGTVTGVTMAVPGKLPMTITGISISATDFMGFVNANDPTGLETQIFSGDDVFGGKAGNDVLYGYGGDDVFNLIKGGNDTANGGDGNDDFKMGAAFNAADQIDGGTGTDRLFLNGDYSAGVTFSATTMVNVEQIILSKGHSYDLTLADATIGAGQKLTVNAEALRTGSNFAIDASADTDGTLRAFGGAYTNEFTGGTGTVQFFGGGASDFFTLESFNANDRISGVGVNDTLTFNGDFSAPTTLTKTEIASVHGITFAAGHDYDFIIGKGFSTVNFTAAALGAGDSLTLDDSAATARVFVTGGNGNNTITTGSEADSIAVSGNGVETIDTGANPSNNADVVQLQTWNDANTVTGQGQIGLYIGGDSSPVTFESGSLHNVVGIQFLGAIDATFQDGNIAPGGALSVVFDSGADFSFDGSAETNGSFNFFVAPTNPTDSVPIGELSGGAGNDVFDCFGLNKNWFSASDQIDGGAGNDVLDIGGGSFAFKASTMTNVETLNVTAGSVATTISLVDANVAAGQTLKVMLSGDITFSGAKETDGAFGISVEGGHMNITGGANDDTVTGSYTGRVNGGDGDDTLSGLSNTNIIFDGGAGADHITGGRTYLYQAVSESTSTTYDTITNANFAQADFVTPVAVTAIDTAVTTGSLSTATFDSDLAAAIGASQLGAGHAVMFTANAGTLAGDHFLIVDQNGVAGYQAGQDLVMQIVNSTGTLATTDFST